MKDRKVIFHINEMDRWTHLLTNLNNFINYDEEANLKVLVNGEGIKGLLRDSHEERRINDLIGFDVEFYACENSIKALKITEDKLIKGINKTPSGVVFLADKQREGYSYIKP